MKVDISSLCYGFILTLLYQISLAGLMFINFQAFHMFDMTKENVGDGDDQNRKSWKLYKKLKMHTVL